jgi:hypothetical protein
MAACVQPDHYRWEAYEPGLYAYYKDPSSVDRFMEQLAEAVRRGETEGRVAPGLHAEYGYMLLAAGRTTEAVGQFELEKKRWPEATVLMDRMIGVVRNKGPNVDKAADAPAKTS